MIKNAHNIKMIKNAIKMIKNAIKRKMIKNKINVRNYQKNQNFKGG